MLQLQERKGKAVCTAFKLCCLMFGQIHWSQSRCLLYDKHKIFIGCVITERSGTDRSLQAGRQAGKVAAHRTAAQMGCKCWLINMTAPLLAITRASADDKMLCHYAVEIRAHGAVTMQDIWGCCSVTYKHLQTL